MHEPAGSGISYSPPYEDSECTGGAYDGCAPANLVGGDAVNDGRCSLIGLTW